VVDVYPINQLPRLVGRIWGRWLS